jgi:uncharacterized protein (TIGR03435 family)
VQPGGRLVVRNSTLKNLIAAAYAMAEIQALLPDRILGGPDWIDSELYNIDARSSTEFHFAPGGLPKDMLLMLLAVFRYSAIMTGRTEARSRSPIHHKRVNWGLRHF